MRLWPRRSTSSRAPPLEGGSVEEPLQALHTVWCACYHPRVRREVTLLILLAASVTAQPQSRVGIIDFFGLRQVPENRARQALGIREGDTIPESEAAAKEFIHASEQRLAALPGVRRAHISGVCCDAGKLILYVGIDEGGGDSLKFSPSPSGAARLPADVLIAERAFEAALQAAVEKGDAGEDDTQGHSLMDNPGARAIQQQFITFAARDEKRLRTVLRESGDADHRATAAQVLGYVKDKRSIVPDLVAAMADPDEGTRNNAMRALSIFAGFADRHPELRIHVPPEPFVHLLNSFWWTDRNKASMALTELAARRDPALLASLRARALDSLVEMARWKSRLHAAAPFFLLGYVAGLPDEEIRKRWKADDRKAVIRTALNTAAPRR